MAGYFDADGVELLVKMFAGIESVPAGGFKFEPRMTYDGADFTWPTENSSRAGAALTIYREAECTTGGIIETTTGDIGYGSGPGFSYLEKLIWGSWSALEGSIISGETAVPKFIVTFSR